MSWSCSVEAAKVSELVEKLEAAPVQAGDFGKAEMLEAAKAAKAAVLSLVSGRAFGADPDMLLTVYMSGHANPEHKHVDGWSDDYINITVKQSVVLKPQE